MRKRFFTLILLIMAMTTSISAYDFMVDGICYNYNGDGTSVTVTFQRSYSFGDGNGMGYGYENISGELIIPENITYNGTTYSVTSIDDWAFYGCSDLTEVTIPNSVTSIGYSAFSGCSGLTSVTIPNSVTSIGERAFSGCSGLTSVNITDLAAWCNIDFRYSDSNPLYYAHNLYLNGSKVSNLMIPNSVTTIKRYAFYNCSGLTSVTIPYSVNSIGESVFNGCTGLTSITWNARHCSDFSSSSKIPFDGLVGISSFTFGDGVERIPSYLCYGLTGLTSVTIPDSVAYIGSLVFKDCSNLTSVTWNAINCRDFLGSNSAPFSGLTDITSFIFCSEVQHIPAYICYGITNLTSATIPNSVISIGDYAFSRCSELTSIVVESGNTKYDSRNNCNAIIETSSNTLIAGCLNTIIPNTVTSIGGSAFSGCSGLTSVAIPNSVTSIGGSAFSGCSGLTSVTIGNSVTSIGWGAFSSCSGLTSVAIPNSVTSIGGSAFSGCSGLTSVTIGNSVTSIGWGAFSSCSGLTSVTIPNSVTSIDSYAFNGCSGLTSVTIPNSVTSIDSYAFNGCSGLTSVAIGNSVTSIPDGCFYNCIGLNTVTIPNSVTSIGSSSFNGCTNLRSIYSKILAPENVSYGTSIFNGVSINYCKLYVPVGTLDSYQFTAPWNDFLNIIEYDYGPEFIMGDANGDGTIDVADYVDVASYILEQDPQPFYFAAADLDEDNSIDVGDLVGVAYLALNYEGKAECTKQNAQCIIHNAQLTNEAREEGKLACAMPCKVEKCNSECIMQNDECSMGAVVQGNEVIINLSNNMDITALQMDINLPQGMTLVDASLTDRASASHQVVFNQLANGDYRLLASSSALKSFKNNDGTVLTLTLAGSPDGNGCLSGIKLAAPSSTRYSIGDIELNFTPTGIDNVTTAARIYSDGSNIIIDSPIDGTAQIVLPNGMNKTVKVATGRNVFETPTKGLIIVKMGNKVEKLQF